MKAYITIYDLRRDKRMIELIQKATLTTKDFGLVPDPALFGSREWWQAIDKGHIQVYTVEGCISKVYMSGHNDFPQFEVYDGNEKSQWVREGDDSAYTIGRNIRIRYVFSKPKKQFGGLSPLSKSVISIEAQIEDSQQGGPAYPPQGVGSADP